MPLLYNILKPFVQTALRLFCRNIFIANKALLHTKGPAIIIANHPNSFLDAIIICSLFKQPVYSLARGDAFKKSLPRLLLSKLLMLPIFRISEGKENLHLNIETFTACQQILRNNGIVLIFIEGICKQQYQLQPFKKGAARIAWDALQTVPQNSVQVIIAAIQYSSFSRFGMQVHLGLQKFMLQNIAAPNQSFSSFTQVFNQSIFNLLQQQLLITHLFTQAQIVLTQATSFVGNANETAIINAKTIEVSKKNTLIYVIGMPVFVIGFLLHAPLYYSLKKWVGAITKGTVFFHSVLFGSLLIAYPLYILFSIAVVQFFCTSNFSVLLLIAMPLLAWYTIRYKQKFIRQQ